MPRILLLPRLPDLDRVIAAGRGQELAVRAVRDAVDDSRVPRESACG